MNVDNKNLPSPIETSEGMRTKNEIMQIAAKIVQENSSMFVANLDVEQRCLQARTTIVSPTSGDYSLRVEITGDFKQKRGRVTDSVYLVWKDGSKGYCLKRTTGAPTEEVQKLARSALENPSNGEEYRKAIAFALTQTMTPTTAGPAELIDAFEETSIPAEEASRLLKEITMKQAACHLPTMSPGETILSDILERKNRPSQPLSLPLNLLRPKN